MSRILIQGMDHAGLGKVFSAKFKTGLMEISPGPQQLLPHSGGARSVWNLVLNWRSVTTSKCSIS